MIRVFDGHTGLRKPSAGHRLTYDVVYIWPLSSHAPSWFLSLLALQENETFYDTVFTSSQAPILWDISKHARRLFSVFTVCYYMLRVSLF